MAKFKVGDRVEYTTFGTTRVGTVREVAEKFHSPGPTQHEGEQTYTVDFGRKPYSKVWESYMRLANSCSRNSKFKSGDIVAYQGSLWKVVAFHSVGMGGFSKDTYDLKSEKTGVVAKDVPDFNIDPKNTLPINANSRAANAVPMEMRTAFRLRLKADHADEYGSYKKGQTFVQYLQGGFSPHHATLVVPGRDVTLEVPWDKVELANACRNATGDEVIASSGKFKLVYNPMGEGYWFYNGSHGEGMRDTSGRTIFGKERKSDAIAEFKRLVATANACRNAKWVILYRDGGKEKIEAPTHDAAKKIADEKSRKSGRGYKSVIVDDGVDYDRYEFFNSRNAVVQKALNAARAKNAITSDEATAKRDVELSLRKIADVSARFAKAKATARATHGDPMWAGWVDLTFLTDEDADAFNPHYLFNKLHDDKGVLPKWSWGIGGFTYDRNGKTWSIHVGRFQT